METAPKRYKYSWPIEATLDVIGGKWKPLVIYQLKEGTLRFNQIVAKVQPRITQRMLSSVSWRVPGLFSGRCTRRYRPK
jgi:DNA-binding HxlR family transcriptional regulator